MRIPIFGVDPEEVGPIELLLIKWTGLKKWANEPLNSVMLVAAAVVLIVGAWQSDVSIPQRPNWGWVAILSSGLGLVVAWRVGGRLAEELHDPDVVYISVLDTYSGDQRIVQVPPEHFAETTIVSHKWDGGEPTEEMIVGRERLHEVVINGIRCYEVDKYDPVLGVAVTSWQANRSGNEIRTDHEQIEHIKTEQDYQIDKVYEILSNETQTIRKAVAVQTNRIVQVAQDVELPQGADLGIHDSLNELFENEGLADDLREQTLDQPVESDLDQERDGEMQDIEVTDP